MRTPERDDLLFWGEILIMLGAVCLSAYLLLR